MHVKSFVVENYRCFDRAAIDFDERATIIVGPNASGKTAILESLSVFLSLLTILTKRTGILTRSFSESDIKKGSGLDHIRYKIDLDVRSFECVITSGHDGLLSVLQNDYLNLAQAIADNRQVFPIMVYYSADRHLYSEDTRLKNDDFLVDGNQAFKNNFAPNVDYASTLKWFKSMDILEAKTVRDTRDVNYRVAELQAVKDVVAKVLMGRYDDPRLDDSGRELLVCDRNSGVFFPISQLSQGYQSILSLSIDLARRMAQANAGSGGCVKSILSSPAIVLIDEIDLHLHPAWEVTLLPALLAAFPGTQFIVTTQSVLVTGSLGPENVRILGRGGGVELVDSDFPWDDFGPILTRVFGVPRANPNIRS
jgi:predicted ATP-binding protein involved in virulence